MNQEVSEINEVDQVVKYVFYVPPLNIKHALLLERNHQSLAQQL